MTYLDPTEAQGRALFMRGPKGPLAMLNLLRLRETADYAASPALAPPAPISGREAYRRYMEHTEPFLRASGGEMMFLGEGGQFFIGPTNERWDLVMLVRQASIESFIAFATNAAYLASDIGRRP